MWSCDIRHHELEITYLTRNWRAMGPDFLEKSCSSTLRSNCNHLHWPLQEESSSDWIQHSHPTQLKPCYLTLMEEINSETRKYISAWLEKDQEPQPYSELIPELWNCISWLWDIFFIYCHQSKISNCLMQLLTWLWKTMHKNALRRDITWVLCSQYSKKLW